MIVFKEKTINKFIFLFLMIWITAPPLQGDTICRFLCLVLLLYLFWKTTKRGTIPIYVLLAFLLIFAMIVVSEFMGDGLNTHMQLYLLMGYTICTAYLSKEEDVRDYLILFPIIFIVMAFWNILTIRALFVDAHVMRYLVRNSTSGYGGFGVGGYGHAYTTVLLLPLAIEFVLKGINKTGRITALFYLITSLYMIFNSGYMIAILATIFGMVCYFFMLRGGRNNFIWIVLVFILLIVIYINIDNILSYIIDSMNVGLMRNKVIEIQRLLIESDEASSIGSSILFGERYERYTRDMGLILNNPIFGALNYMKVGKHSTILDMFAQYGIPAGIIFCYVLIKPLRSSLKNRIQTANVEGATIIELVFILLINNASMGMGIIYILLPIYTLFRQKSISV